MKRESISGTDRAWLRMDRATNLMIINGVMLFDEVLEYERVLALLNTGLVEPYERFSQRPVESSSNSGRLYWELDPYFDLRSHVVRIGLPEPGDTVELQNLMSSLMGTALDANHPLWRAYLIEGVNGGSAVFMRIHHSLADGIALIRVMLSLTALEPGAAARPGADDSKHSASTGFRPLRTAFGLARTASGRIASAAKLVTRESLHIVGNPGYPLARAKAAGLMTAAGAAILTRLLVIPPDRKSVFRGELGATKRVVWSDPVDLADVKALGRATDATVNDVLIAALSGALRTYMQQYGDNVDGEDVRAMVPVNLRPLDQEIELGNQFGLVYLSLPVSVDGPLRRLYEVKRRMDVLKSSPEAVITYQVLNILGRLPGELAERAVNMFAGKASAVLTNVPGPRSTLYFAGAPIQRMMFWVPQSGDIGLGISILSYAGSVTLGIAIDESLITHPHEIMASFQTEFAILAEAVKKASPDPT